MQQGTAQALPLIYWNIVVLLRRLMYASEILYAFLFVVNDEHDIMTRP